MLPTKEKHQQFKDIDLATLRPQNNLVVCRKATNNMKTGTKGGILYPEHMNVNQYVDQNVDRVYEVVKLPERLTYDEAFWETKIEIKVGDLVWVNKVNAINAPKIQTDEELFLLNYYEMIVAKRRVHKFDFKDTHSHLTEDQKTFKVIPLNGYLLCSDVYDFVTKPKGLFLTTTKRLNPFKAKIEFVGKPVKYNFADLMDADVKHGDEVYLELDNKNDAIIIRNYLEDGKWAVFNGNKQYFYIQRHEINALVVH